MNRKESFLRLIPGELLLEKLKVRVKRRKGAENLCWCPLPGHVDKTPSFSYNTELNVYNCFVCGGGNAVTLVAKVHKCNIVRAILWLEETFGVSMDDIPMAFELFKDTLGEEESSEQSVKMDDSLLDDYIKTPSKYFLGRGFTVQDWKKWNLRWYKDAFDVERLIIPSYDAEGNMAGISARFCSITTDTRYVHFFDTRKNLYGLQRKKQEKAILVEGFIGVWYLSKFIKDYDIVASYRAGCSSEQLGLLVGNWEKVVFMYDNDEAGKIHSEKVSKALKNKIRVASVQYSEKDTKDIEFLGCERARMLINKARFF